MEFARAFNEEPHSGARKLARACLAASAREAVAGRGSSNCRAQERRGGCRPSSRPA